MTPHRPFRALRRVAGPAALALALTLAVPALTGCDPAEAGAAALVGSYRITERQVQTDASDVREAIEEAGAAAPAGDALLLATVQRRITARLTTVAAEREGITVTQGEIDRLIQDSGGREAVNESLAQGNGVPAAEVDAFARTYLQLQKLGAELAPTAAEEQQAAAARQYLGELSEELGVDVSPRYGTWDATEVVVVPTPNDLSEPADAE